MNLQIKVIPKSSRNRIVGWIGDRLKIAVTAPPERGKANGEVVDLLSEALDVPGAAIRIVSGLGSPLKTVEIAADDPARILSKLPAR